MTTALLIVDIQNDYFPGGTMEVVGAAAAAAQAAKCWLRFAGKVILSFTSSTSLPVPGRLSSCPTRKARRFTSPSVPVLAKPTSRSIFRTAFGRRPSGAFASFEELSPGHRGNDDAYVYRFGHRAAADLGFTCSLAHDACATRALSFNGVQVSAENVQTAYLAALNGLFAKVLSADDCCSGL